MVSNFKIALLSAVALSTVMASFDVHAAGGKRERKTHPASTSQNKERVHPKEPLSRAYLQDIIALSNSSLDLCRETAAQLENEKSEDLIEQLENKYLSLTQELDLSAELLLRYAHEDPKALEALGRMFLFQEKDIYFPQVSTLFFDIAQSPLLATWLMEEAMTPTATHHEEALEEFILRFEAYNQNGVMEDGDGSRIIVQFLLHYIDKSTNPDPNFVRPIVNQYLFAIESEVDNARTPGSYIDLLIRGIEKRMNVPSVATALEAMTNDSDMDRVKKLQTCSRLSKTIDRVLKRRLLSAKRDQLKTCNALLEEIKSKLRSKEENLSLPISLYEVIKEDLGFDEAQADAYIAEFKPKIEERLWETGDEEFDLSPLPPFPPSSLVLFEEVEQSILPQFSPSSLVTFEDMIFEEMAFEEPAEGIRALKGIMSLDADKKSPRMGKRPAPTSLSSLGEDPKGIKTPPKKLKTASDQDPMDVGDD